MPSFDRFLARPLVVAIPVRDEADRIAACLRALGEQERASFDHVVLLLNNCTDDTASRARDAARHLPFELCCVERLYPRAFAHAGTARREAMAIAAGLAGPDGILFTTDADGAAQPDWLSANLQALAQGAEVVCGRAVIDPVEALAIPAQLHRDDDAEVAYATLLDRIHHLVDPDPADPWPRHVEHSGASIAVTAQAWALVSGVPALPSGEDRGFLHALRRADRRIRHAPDAVVTVSGRTVGRAPGGMAETIARRVLHQDEMLDDSLEPAGNCLRRAEARASLRGLRDARLAGLLDPQALSAYAARVSLPPGLVRQWLEEPCFGTAWARVEAESVSLYRHPVRRAELVRHRDEAERIIYRLEQAARQDQANGKRIPKAQRPPGVQAVQSGPRRAQPAATTLRPDIR